MKVFIASIIFVATFSCLLGQGTPNLYGFTKSNEIPVFHKGKSIDFAWSGGINNGQVNTIDLNRDGVQDLVIFDKEGKNFHTYLTLTSVSGTHYEYAPQFEKYMPPSDPYNHWVLFRDYNCDGKKDIFLGYQSYLYVWKNTSNGTNLSFTAINNGQRIESKYKHGVLGLFISPANLPGIADINKDGAIDILTYSNNSSEMEYHQGQVPCGLDLEELEICWGHFTETGAAPGATLNACIPRKKKTMDGSSTILPLDLNNDQVMDLLLGNNTFPSLAALYNGGTLDSAHMTAQTIQFPSSHPVNITSTPAAFYEDVDFDGLRDLVVSPGLISLYSLNKNSLYFYKNTGNSSTPNFVFQQDDFLQKEMIDVGERSVPKLVDLNSDGKLDLVVSNSHYQLKDSVAGHSYHYYQNTGTLAQPEFTLIDTNFMDISANGISSNSIPCFGDLDGDGDLDALVGDLNGNLHYFENSSMVSPNFSLISPIFQNIDVGKFAAPYLYDIDSNGTLDLFVGNEAGTIYYYSNNSASKPSFSLETTRFGGFKLPPVNAGYSIPYLFKNNSGNDNLFVGSNFSGVYQFDSISQVMNLPQLLQPNIGSGKISSTNRLQTPFGTKKKNGRNQFLIRASELQAAGLSHGYIGSISFKITTSSNNHIENLQIRIKNTNDSVLNTFHSGGFQEVFDGREGATQGWQSFIFTNDVLWDGVSNILVETCFSGQPKSRDVHVEMTDVGYNANAYGAYVDSTNQANGCQQPYLGSTTLRPNIKIVLKPAFANTENYSSGLYTAPAIADLNNDGFIDMIVGNMNGGLTYYKGKIYDVGIHENRNESTKLQVFPNPGDGNYAINTPNVGNAKLNVFNLNGRLIMTQEINSDKTQISLANQPDGMYLFILQDKQELRTAKVIKR